MEKNRLAGNLGADNASIPQGDDYGYDEAHGFPAGPPAATPSRHRVDPLPKVDLSEDGDYGYDEAHGFGAH